VNRMNRHTHQPKGKGIRCKLFGIKFLKEIWADV